MRSSTGGRAQHAGGAHPPGTRSIGRLHSASMSRGRRGTKSAAGIAGSADARFERVVIAGGGSLMRHAPGGPAGEAIVRGVTASAVAGRWFGRRRRRPGRGSAERMGGAASGSAGRRGAWPGINAAVTHNRKGPSRPVKRAEPEGWTVMRASAVVEKGGASRVRAAAVRPDASAEWGGQAGLKSGGTVPKGDGVEGGRATGFQGRLFDGMSHTLLHGRPALKAGMSGASTWYGKRALENQGAGMNGAAAGVGE